MRNQIWLKKPTTYRYISIWPNFWMDIPLSQTSREISLLGCVLWSKTLMKTQHLGTSVGCAKNYSLSKTLEYTCSCPMYTLIKHFNKIQLFEFLLIKLTASGDQNFLCLRPGQATGSSVGLSTCREKHVKKGGEWGILRLMGTL